MFLILSVGIILGWLLHGSVNRRKSNTHLDEDAVADQKMT
jgi:hypothetical protein